MATATWWNGIARTLPGARSLGSRADPRASAPRIRPRCRPVRAVPALVRRRRREHGQLQPDAMVVATSTPDGRPSARMVLLRGVDARGFCFFTNFDSRKGERARRQPARGDRVALARGPAPGARHRARSSASTDAESDAYWYARPRASRVSAWASAQSEPVADRDGARGRAWRDVEARFADVRGAAPAGWGGFRVVPDEIEFWQHRDDRLHDRLRYYVAPAATVGGRRLQPVVRAQPVTRSSVSTIGHEHDEATEHPQPGDEREHHADRPVERRRLRHQQRHDVGAGDLQRLEPDRADDRRRAGGSATAAPAGWAGSTTSRATAPCSRKSSARGPSGATRTRERGEPGGDEGSRARGARRSPRASRDRRVALA